MKNTLLALFLTLTFAFSSYADTTKVLSVVTNGTEVITITERTHKEDIAAGSAGLSGIYIETVTTTNVSVSTIPTPLTEKQKEKRKELQKRMANGDFSIKPEEYDYAFPDDPSKNKDWRTSQKKAYLNAFEFLSKPVSKKEEK